MQRHVEIDKDDLAILGELPDLDLVDVLQQRHASFVDAQRFEIDDFRAIVEKLLPES